MKASKSVIKVAGKQADARTLETARAVQVEEVYVDSLAQALLGVPVSKLTFETVTHLEDGSEKSVPRVRIVMATSSLLRFCIETLEAFADAKESLAGVSKRNGTELAKLMERAAKFAPLDEGEDSSAD